MHRRLLLRRLQHTRLRDILPSTLCLCRRIKSSERMSVLSFRQQSLAGRDCPRLRGLRTFAEQSSQGYRRLLTDLPEIRPVRRNLQAEDCLVPWIRDSQAAAQMLTFWAQNVRCTCYGGGMMRSWKKPLVSRSAGEILSSASNIALPRTIIPNVDNPWRREM